MDKFFIRFRLQSSFGTFGEEFPYESIMETTPQEVAAFIREGEEWQQEQAKNLNAAMDIKVLQNKKVMFVGDSITADRLSYRGIVTKAAKLNECNASVSGAVTTNMLLTFENHLLSFNPEIVSVMLGTNDSLIISGKKNFVSKQEYADNLDAIISLSKEAGAKIILTTPPPIDEKRFNFQYRENNNSNIKDYCDIIRKKAAEHGVILNDFADKAKNEDFEKIIENDGVHLTPCGQALLAKEWLCTLIQNI
ncbi:MAG: hypothetical protein IKV64_05780 [Clostridia bacterium]|nr:hypothetical protein [Clostridia bacterium]